MSRRFGNEVALDHLDLEIAQGEIIALLGPNGAGKTTTIRVLNGILSPDAGSATVLGFDPTIDGEAVRARTGVLTEHAGLDDRLSTEENLRLVAGIRQIPEARATRRIDELLEQFGIGDLRHRLTHGFSTGERKRVALARALLDDPEVLFLDEPTSGLDPTATREVTDLIAMLAAERGRTIVLCTHVLAEAERLPARVVILDRGSVLANGYMHDLITDLWQDTAVDIDIGRSNDQAITDAIDHCRAMPSVNTCDRHGSMLHFRITDRNDVPSVIRQLTADAIDVYEARVQVPSLEDVYFETIARAESSAHTRPATPIPPRPETRRAVMAS